MRKPATPEPAERERKFAAVDESREHSPSQLLAAWLRRRLSADDEPRVSDGESPSVAEMELP